jgi:RimJ/RimL family protein N-acetyltransferase
VETPSRRAACPLADASTARLSVRRLRTEDRDELVEVFRDPEVWWFEYERGLEPAETDAFLDRQRHLWDAYDFGGCAVRDREQGTLLGVVGLGVPTLSHPSLPDVTIGWRFGRAAWGHGFATEAATALLQQAFGPMRVPAVGCVTNRDNARSIAVARRLRMDAVGEQTGRADDGRRDVVAVLLRVDRATWTMQSTDE